MKDSNRYRKESQRSGVASFELVMSFPILMFLVAMLYTVYISTMMKSQLTMEVRHNAWLKRSTPLNVQHPPTPFAMTAVGQQGWGFSQLQRKVQVYSKFIPGTSNTPRNIVWGNVLLTGSWDDRQVKFPKGTAVYPHLTVLGQMASGGVTGLEGAGQASGLGGLPGL